MTTSNYSCVTNTSTFNGELGGNKDDIISLNCFKNTTANLSGYKSITSYKSGSIFGFSKLKAIAVRMSIDVNALLELKSNLKMDIASFIDIDGQIVFDSVKKFAIANNIDTDILIALAERARIAIDGNIDLTVWENNLLENLDDLLLSELDNLDLGMIDRDEGVKFSALKKFAIDANNQTNFVLDLYMYYYAKLNEYDNTLLNTMDNVNLIDLDRYLI